MNSSDIMSLKVKLFYIVGRIGIFRIIFSILFYFPHLSRKFSFRKIILRKFKVDAIKVDETDVFIIQKENKNNGINLLFLHGGAYVMEATYLHWNFIKKIIDRSDIRVTFIKYPLAPENDYRDVRKALIKSYDLIINKFPEDKIYLMGDSAGGGLALSFIQYLRDIGYPQGPLKTVLFSPWLDLSMNNPAINDLRSKDVLLSIRALKRSANFYANGLMLNDSNLSPIYGEMNNLGEVLLIVGTEELFYPDCIRLKEKIKDSNTEIQFVEGNRLFHDWAIFPMPESEMAIKKVIEFILK